MYIYVRLVATVPCILTDGPLVGPRKVDRPGAHGAVKGAGGAVRPDGARELRRPHCAKGAEVAGGAEPVAGLRGEPLAGTVAPRGAPELPPALAVVAGLTDDLPCAGAVVGGVAAGGVKPPRRRLRHGTPFGAKHGGRLTGRAGARRVVEVDVVMVVVWLVRVLVSDAAADTHVVPLVVFAPVRDTVAHVVVRLVLGGGVVRRRTVLRVERWGETGEGREVV